MRNQGSNFVTGSKYGTLEPVLGTGSAISARKSLLQETPSGRKKIIPVGSDFDSSPSPESPRGSANNTSAETAPSPFKKSPTKSLLSKDQSFEAEDDVDKKRKSIGLKLKTSYSECYDDKTIMTDTGSEISAARALDSFGGSVVSYLIHVAGLAGRTHRILISLAYQYHRLISPRVCVYGGIMQNLTMVT